MTRLEHEIRRRILRKLRSRIALEADRARKAYLLGLEAGELMKGGESFEDLWALQRNYDEAEKLGVEIRTETQP